MCQCKVCGKEFQKRVSLDRHIGTSFGKEKIKIHCPLLEYMNIYEGRSEFSKQSLQFMYENQRKSTLMMSDELRIPKLTLLHIMHYYGIHMRDLSEATINQIARDGLWNKGKTKFNHPAIMSYAKAREGKNNPYYTAPGFPERHEKNIKRWREIQTRNNGAGRHDPKTTEMRMKAILDEAKIQYVRNFCLKFGKTWRLFDFLIEGKLIVEMNGNYYHANPRFYKRDDTIVIASKRKSAAAIWKHDREKARLARSFGYPYLVLWEDEFSAMSDASALTLIRGIING